MNQDQWKLVALIVVLLFVVRSLRGKLSPEGKLLVSAAGLAINLGIV